MKRLKPNEVKAWRESQLKAQDGFCALCGLALDPADAVADHHHRKGWMRGVLHRGCNALLGKVENNWKRVGVPGLGNFLSNAYKYIVCGENTPLVTDVYHPSFRTEEEKRLRRNKRARLKRKKGKR